MAAAVGTAHSTVWKVLHEQLLHPYKRQEVQSLNTGDYLHRQEFVQWFLWKIRWDSDFPKFILFTDEVLCLPEKESSTVTTATWADENPHAVRVGNYQTNKEAVQREHLGWYLGRQLSPRTSHSAQLPAQGLLFDISAGYPPGLCRVRASRHSPKHVIST